MTSAMAKAIVVGGARSEWLWLTVLYDERCPLCRRLKDWLAHGRLAVNGACRSCP